MRARVLQLHPMTAKKLWRLRNEAEVDGVYRVARRLHAVLLNHGGNTSGEIATLLDSPRSRVSEWLKNYEDYGYDGLLEGYRPGRPPTLTSEQKHALEDILDSGPVAYAFTSGVWTSPMVARVVHEEVSTTIRVRCRLPSGSREKTHAPTGIHGAASHAQAGPSRSTETGPVAPSHVSQLKKKATALGAALIHSDEATFRQDSTLHHTWARRGCQPVVPVTGQRTTVKVFGCVDVHAARFLYRREEVFNTVTYLGFLEQIARHYYPRPVIWIQDNASYHKHGDVWAWFSEHRHWWEVVNQECRRTRQHSTRRNGYGITPE